MLDGTVYQLVGALEKKLQQVMGYVAQLEQSVRLAFTGETVRAEALQKLLLDKGIFTQEELTKAIGETIQKMQAEAEDRAKAAGITIPTAEQVQQVTETKGQAEAPATPSTEPQA